MATPNTPLSQPDVDAFNKLLDWSRLARELGAEQVGIDLDLVEGGWLCTVWLHSSGNCRPFASKPSASIADAIREALASAASIENALAELATRPERPTTVADDVTACIA